MSHIALYQIEHTEQIIKDNLLFIILKEKYEKDIMIGTDNKEHYARLEMCFEEYVEKMLKK